MRGVAIAVVRLVSLVGPILVLLFAGIAAAENTSFPLTLTDDLGQTITLARRPERIVSLAPNITEILFAIGAGDRVVGVTRFCNYPPEAKTRTPVGGYTDLRIEAVLGLAPDLVVASRGNPRSQIDALQAQGPRLLAVAPETLDDLRRAIRLIGRATGQAAPADAVVREMDRTLEAVREAVGGAPRRPRVYFGSLTAPHFSAGPASLIGQCITLAGGDNITSGLREPWPNLSIETILARDPEVIIEGFQATPGGEARRRVLLERLRADPVWSQIAAVRAGRVHALDDDAIHRAGPRLAQAVAEMARLFLPERFPRDAASNPR